jgi:hypothetical protein
MSNLNRRWQPPFASTYHPELKGSWNSEGHGGGVIELDGDEWGKGWEGGMDGWDNNERGHGVRGGGADDSFHTSHFDSYVETLGQTVSFAELIEWFPAGR